MTKGDDAQSGNGRGISFDFLIRLWYIPVPNSLISEKAQ
jgi:hypothetical protein